MTTRIRVYTPLLREAIEEARDPGFEDAASEREQTSGAAFTTSSEMLQEHGLAIKHFLTVTRANLPRSTAEKLRACLTETELARSDWRRFWSRLKRRHTLS